VKQSRVDMPEEQVHADVVHVVAAHRDHDREALAREVGERARDAEGHQNSAQHPCQDQDVQMIHLRRDLLKDDVDDLEERREQAAHHERPEEEHAARGLLDRESRLGEAHETAHVTERDADSSEHDVEPHDEPHAVPNAPAELLVALRPRTDRLHADGHGETGKRKERTEIAPLLNILVNGEASENAADDAHGDKRRTAHEELQRRSRQNRLPKRKNSLRDEREHTANEKRIHYRLIRLHDHPLTMQPVDIAKPHG